MTCQTEKFDFVGIYLQLDSICLLLQIQPENPSEIDEKHDIL